MNGKIYNKEITQSYLLGTLSEDQTLRLDELSIIDDDFNGFLRNAENDLVDAYVNGSLDEPTSKRFESFYLATPKRRQKVAFARTFHQRTDRDPTTESPAATVVASSSPGTIGFLDKLRLALRPATLAFGAVALLCLIGSIWLIRNARQPEPGDVAVTGPTPIVAANDMRQQDRSVATEPSPEPIQPVVVETPHAKGPVANQPEPAKTPVAEPRSAPVIATFVLPAPLRGASDIKTLTVASNVERIAFHLELEAVDYKTYSIELRNRANSKVVWNAGRLRSKGEEQKSLTLSVPGRLLRPGLYVLRVSGVSDAGAENIGDYAFKIVR
jgi:hypothetical protein